MRACVFLHKNYAYFCEQPLTSPYLSSQTTTLPLSFSFSLPPSSHQALPVALAVTGGAAALSLGSVDASGADNIPPPTNRPEMLGKVLSYDAARFVFFSSFFFFFFVFSLSSPPPSLSLTFFPLLPLLPPPPLPPFFFSLSPQLEERLPSLQRGLRHLSQPRRYPLRYVGEHHPFGRGSQV